MTDANTCTDTVFFTDDGRCFVDMAYLYETWDNDVSAMEKALNQVGGNDYAMGHIAGRRFVVESMRQQTDILNLNESLEISEDN